MWWKIVLGVAGGGILLSTITYLTEKANEAVERSTYEAMKKALRSDPEIDYPEPTETNLDID